MTTPITLSADHAAALMHGPVTVVAKMVQPPNSVRVTARELSRKSNTRTSVINSLVWDAERCETYPVLDTSLLFSARNC